MSAVSVVSGGAHRADGAGGAREPLAVGTAKGRVRKLAGIERRARDELRSAVDEARREGASWSEIARLLGVSKASAHERFSGARADRTRDA